MVSGYNQRVDHQNIQMSCPHCGKAFAPSQSDVAAVLGQVGGRKVAAARAAKMTPEQRSAKRKLYAVAAREAKRRCQSAVRSCEQGHRIGAVQGVIE